MEYTADELISMAASLCAAFYGITYARGLDIARSGEMWGRMADTAFAHLDYIKHDRNMAMMDAEMGLG